MILIFILGVQGLVSCNNEEKKLLFESPLEVKARAITTSQASISAEPTLVIQFRLATVNVASCIGASVHAIMKPYFTFEGGKLDYEELEFDLLDDADMQRHQRKVDSITKSIKK